MKIQFKRGTNTLVGAATKFTSELFYDSTNTNFWVGTGDNSTNMVAVNKVFTNAGTPATGSMIGCLVVDTTNNVLYYCSATDTFTKVSLKLDDNTTASTSVWSSTKTQSAITNALVGIGEFQDSVISKTRTTAPSNPSNGDRYIVGTVTDDQDAWYGHNNAITQYATNAWTFKAATEGMACYNDGDDLLYIFTGSSWVPLNNYALASSEPGTVSSSSSGAVGEASTIARGDHSHDLGTHAHSSSSDGGTISYANLTSVPSTFAPAANSVSATELAHGTRGDIMIYGASGVPTVLAAGNAGQALITGGIDANASWGAPAPANHALTNAAHAMTGMTVGHVLRATGADTFAFGALQTSDLPDVDGGALA